MWASDENFDFQIRFFLHKQASPAVLPNRRHRHLKMRESLRDAIVLQILQAHCLFCWLDHLLEGPVQ